jgi:uncharacterized protein YprB with RNaseH-like and TPR domain
MNNDSAKILIWDIESTHLKADWATLRCIGWKWYGDPAVHVPSLMDYRGWNRDVTDDRKLLADFHKVLMEADMLVTYFGKGFDLKMIQSKFLEYDLPVLPSIPHVDLFFTVKSNMTLTRKSLDNVSRYLNLENEKSYVSGKIWKRAMAGHPESINYVIEHCKADVLVLEELYTKLKPLVRTHPRVAGWEPCRTCGSTKLQSRGQALTISKGTRYRIQCQDCGAWETRSSKHMEDSGIED